MYIIKFKNETDKLKGRLKSVPYDRVSGSDSCKGGIAALPQGMDKLMGRLKSVPYDRVSGSDSRKGGIVALPQVKYKPIAVREGLQPSRR